MMRWVVVAVLLTVLIVDVGYTALVTRPYTVTGWHFEGAPNELRVEFTNPAGGRATIGVPGFKVTDCWHRLGLGYKVPAECQP